jgi:hypothetical protein
MATASQQLARAVSVVIGVNERVKKENLIQGPVAQPWISASDWRQGLEQCSRVYSR